MKLKEFIENTIPSLDPTSFEVLKKSLINDKYIPVSFLEVEEMDVPALEEKIKDYFEKVVEHYNNSFTNTVENYATFLDSVVLDHIDKYSESDKSSLSRAKRYYDKARSMKKAGLNTFEQLLDYSRIMLCLYMAIINNKHNGISDFNYESKCLDGKEIMKNLRREEVSNLISKRKRFDTSEPYGSDRSAFVMLMIMYRYIKNMEVEG